MRWLLVMIMSAQGDMQTVQIPMEDVLLCDRAKKQIIEDLTKAPSGVILHGAYCMEVKY